MKSDTTLDELQAMCEAPPRKVEPLPQEKLVLYGAGNKGREVLHALRAGGHQVEAFIDQRKVDAIDGVPVLPPDDPRVRSLAQVGCTAIVSVFNFSVDPLVIHALLDTIGFRRVVGFAELRQLAAVGETYWLDESTRMKPSAPIARILWERFRDPDSRQTFAEAVRLRHTLDPRHLRLLNAFDQYVPVTVPTPRTHLRFVDGGAYDGDTLIAMKKTGCDFTAVAAFEPDPGNYERLAGVARGADLGQEVALFPCGLGSRTEQVRFRSQGLSSSSIAPDGDAIIQVVALDDCAPHFRPNYVKLDIEGAEGHALRGMAKTIQTSRPALAICVYHKPADLWELPMLVDELLPDCKLYLRAHTWNGFDLVLYAVPHEMAH